MDNKSTPTMSEFLFDYKLLDIQQMATIITLYSDIVSYSSVLEGKALIEANYNNEEVGYSPDRTALESLYIYLFAKLMFTQVGFQRFNSYYNQYINGELEYSLEPNISINIGNIFGLIGLIFLIHGAEGIYARDITQPIFGVR